MTAEPPMIEVSETSYEQIQNKLRGWVANLERQGKADEPLFKKAGAHGEGEGVSPRQLLAEVESHSKFGVEFVRNWFDLALNYILEAPDDAPTD